MVGSHKPGCKENPFEPCPSGKVLLLTCTSPYVIYIILPLVSSCQLSYRILPNFLWFSKLSLAFAFRGKNVQWFWEGWRHFLGEEKVLWLVTFLCTMPSNKSGIFSIWYAICALHILAFSCYVQYFCTVFLSSFVWRQLMNGAHKHIVIIPGLHMITWWSRMNAFFSAENLNCIFMQIPWKRMLFYGQTQRCSCLVMWFKQRVTSLVIANCMHIFGSVPRDCLNLYGNVNLLPTIKLLVLKIFWCYLKHEAT